MRSKESGRCEEGRKVNKKGRIEREKEDEKGEEGETSP